ncbi:hypothetical protein PSPO01_13707 [Paraphaeosphaeria sporulosa]
MSALQQSHGPKSASPRLQTALLCLRAPAWNASCASSQERRPPNCCCLSPHCAGVCWHAGSSRLSLRVLPIRASADLVECGQPQQRADRPARGPSVVCVESAARRARVPSLASHRSASLCTLETTGQSIARLSIPPLLATPCSRRARLRVPTASGSEHPNVPVPRSFPW